MSRKRTTVRTGKDKTTCFAYYPESVDGHVGGADKQKRLQAESSRCREVLKTMQEYQHNDESVMSVRESKSDLPPPLHHDSFMSFLLEASVESKKMHPRQWRPIKFL